MALGKVIDKERLIFYKAGHGFYRFNPSDQSCSDIPISELPVCLEQKDRRCKPTPTIVNFGGSYFLDRLLGSIDYYTVIDSIGYSNTDRLHSMLAYYVLSNRAHCHAEEWYMHNYTKYLYPKANLAGQRISEFLVSIGQEEKVKMFLREHIDYVLEGTDREKCVLIDSTGCPNKCSMYDDSPKCFRSTFMLDS